MTLTSVHLTNYYHDQSGGISTSYNNLLNAAERHQRRVRLIVPGNELSWRDVNSFARIYYVPAIRSPLVDRRYRLIMPWQYMLNSSVVRHLLLSIDPDMIEVADKYTLSMIGPMVRRNRFKQLGRPMLVHFSCERMDDNVATYLAGGASGRKFARMFVNNYLLPAFDYHIANSDYTASEFIDSAVRGSDGEASGWFGRSCRRFLRAPSVPLQDRVFVCPRGVDTRLYSPKRRAAKTRERLAARAGIETDSVILLYAGRVAREKNIELLVEMMAILADDQKHDYRLLVAGAGPQQEWLEEQSRSRLSGKCVILGHLASEELADLYANADVFVHPNPREPFGIAPLEAMASGLPLVAPDQGGVLTYANESNAWLAEPTAEAFATAVVHAASNTGTKRDKQNQAIKTSREFSFEAAADRLFETYDTMYERFVRQNDLFTHSPAKVPAHLAPGLLKRPQQR